MYHRREKEFEASRKVSQELRGTAKRRKKNLKDLENSPTKCSVNIESETGRECHENYASLSVLTKGKVQTPINIGRDSLNSSMRLSAGLQLLG